MSAIGWILVGIGVLVALAGLFLVAAYNRLVRRRQNVHEAWSAIDTELQRRYDLIPSLVETVKGYAAHERQTLERVIAARNVAASGRGPDEPHQRHEAAMVDALGRLLVLVEQYPQLKASERFLQLQRELVETEGRLSKARRFYNANVRELNTAILSFPWSLVAGPAGFQAQPYFEVEETARAAPQVRV